MEEVIKNENRKVKVLNLFAYTGGASLAAARAGAEVCHVDGSKTAVAWARDRTAKDAPTGTKRTRRGGITAAVGSVASRPRMNAEVLFKALSSQAVVAAK